MCRFPGHSSQQSLITFCDAMLEHIEVGSQAAPAMVALERLLEVPLCIENFRLKQRPSVRAIVALLRLKLEHPRGLSRSGRGVAESQQALSAKDRCADITGGMLRGLLELVGCKSPPFATQQLQT